MYVDVLVELKAKQIDKTFTYKVDTSIKNQIEIGKRVLVPFGNQKLEGFILDIHTDFSNDYQVKNIIKVVDNNPVLNNEMIELGKYISKKTLCNLISAYQCMLPSALKAHNNFIINKKIVTYINLLDRSYIPQNPKQKQIITLLLDGKKLKSELLIISSSSLKTLINNNIVVEEKTEIYRLNDNFNNISKQIILNDEQKCVVNEVKKNLNRFIPYLLHGVTGSGKTEVYIHIIQEVLKEGKEVILLVPEISLTPQMVNIFKNRFKNSIAILHSALSDGEKYDEWRKIEKREVSIVIGARSAIFAPFTNLGLIILDEEHSDTYKQDCNPKYDAIDIAIRRAKTYSCPLILGSATPSIESYTRAKQGIYQLLLLKDRINKTMPIINIVDMKKEIQKGNKILSEELYDDIKDRLYKKEQIILLLNRRGYTTTIICKECGSVIKCPNCDITLTYHKEGNKLNCHYCNYTTYKPTKCKECGSTNINEFGMGTEKLEEEIKNLFKDAKTVRMDVDTTSKKGSHSRIINDFKLKKYNILIGTQMIAKGLDFDDVTLVGVINGDATLNIPDFRSGERTFSLLNQVAGRSGRSSKKGKVIFQCFNTQHYSIIYASKNQYNDFYLEEMNIRKKLKYPPYYNLCLIKLISSDYNLLIEESNKVRKHLLENTNKTIVLGPSLSSIAKTFNKYNMQLLLKYKSINQVYDTLKLILEKTKMKSKIIIDIDFNPKKI